MASALVIGLVMLCVIFIGFAIFIIGFIAIEFVKTMFLKAKAPKDKASLMMPDVPPEKEIIGKEVYTDDSERIRKQRDFERLRKFADSESTKRERGTNAGTTTGQNEGDNGRRINVPDTVNRNFESFDRGNRTDPTSYRTHTKRFKVHRFDA